VSTDEPKDYGMCVHCNERPATGKWVDDGGVFAYTHGWYEFWCEPCMVKAQIQYARECAERLPELEARLAELESSR
jgi:hypothetical protein